MTAYDNCSAAHQGRLLTLYVYNSTAPDRSKGEVNRPTCPPILGGVYAYDDGGALRRWAVTASTTKGVGAAYAYAGDDPVNNSDPSGEDPFGNVGIGVFGTVQPSGDCSQSAVDVSVTGPVSHFSGFWHANLTRTHPYDEKQFDTARITAQYNYQSNYFQWSVFPTPLTIDALDHTLSATANGSYSVDGSSLRSPSYHEQSEPIQYLYHASFSQYVKWYYLPWQNNHLAPGNTVGVGLHIEDPLSGNFFFANWTTKIN